MKIDFDLADMMRKMSKAFNNYLKVSSREKFDLYVSTFGKVAKQQQSSVGSKRLLSARGWKATQDSIH